MTRIFIGAAAAIFVLSATLIVLVAEGVETMEEPSLLIATIKAEEGFRAKPYRDSRGVLTIGYGTNISEGISRAEGEFLLRSRLQVARERLARAWEPFVEQPEHVQDALNDMAYQIGVHGVIEFKDMLAALARGDTAGAVRAGQASDWYRETHERAKRVLSYLRGS